MENNIMHDIKEDRDFKIIEKDFARIAKNIALFWGTDMLCDYIDGVLKDTRDHERQGFPLNVFDSMTKLKTVHMRMYPQFVKPWKPDDWFVFR